MFAEHAHNHWREVLGSLPILGNISRLVGIGSERYIDPSLNAYKGKGKTGLLWNRKNRYSVMRNLDNGYREHVGSGYFSNSKKAKEHFSKRP